MSRERLELVTDFSSLRAGMIVVIRPCFECGSTHRMLLTRRSPFHMSGPTIDGEMWSGHAWFYEPAAPCDEEWGSWGPAAITTMTMERGALYRVQDGLEQQRAASETSEQPKTLVKHGR